MGSVTRELARRRIDKFLNETRAEVDVATTTTTFGPLDKYVAANDNEPPRIGDFMQVFTGRKYWPMDPRPHEVHIEDIAHSLAMQARYAGHVKKFYCPTPDQRVLTDDLRWVAAGDLKVGDGLLAFDEEPSRVGGFGKNRRRLKPANVTIAQAEKRRTIRLVMSDGSDVVSSDEHPWLVATKVSGNQKWLTAGAIADDLRIGRKRHMHKFFEPWAARSGREAGWLAGIYDGEGYLSIKNRRGTQLGVAQKPGVVLSEIERLLKNFGYSNYRYAQTGNAGSGVISLQSQGGFATIAHLLGSLQPIRLVSKFVNSLRSGEFDKQLQSDGVPLEIVAAYDEGEQWVAGLETSSHTYFCEGFGAHNCVAEHSVLIARHLAAKHAPEVALAGLLHDAPEAYCVDIPRPLKPYLTNYKEIEQKNWLAIAARFQLDRELPDEVHDADNRIIADELVNLVPMPWHARHNNPLGVRLRYWWPEKAETEFLATFDALMAGRAA